MTFKVFKNSVSLLILLASGTLPGVTMLPVEIGGPIQISPTPGPSNPDPILENLVLVMDNHYQPPYYLGGAPDYLSQIYYFSDNYIGNTLSFDPYDSSRVHFSISQNLIHDQTQTFYYVTLGTNTFATSLDKGASWSYGPPIEQIIPLGGTISQIINASIGPGLFYEYAKNGRLVGSGWGFFDMIANPPNAIPKSGFLFTSSDNNGASWATPEVVATNIGDNWFNTPSYSAKPPGWLEFYTTIDPSNPDVIHCSTTVANPSARAARFAYGSITDGPGNGSTAYQLYFNSQDGGKTFSCPVMPYNPMDDSDWLTKHFDPNFTYSPYVFECGAYISSVGHPMVLDNEVIALPVKRNYPNIGDLIFYNDYVTTTADQGVIISRDNGKTWCKTMGATDQFIDSPPVYDPGFWNPGIPENVNGYYVYGYTLDGGYQASRSANKFAQLSASTGRIYMSYRAADPDHPIFDQDVVIATSMILLSSSDDQGKTWSPAVKINRTPTNIEPRAQQAFSHSASISLDGWYVVSYYDFRNWALNGGVPGEDLLTTPLQTDAWLAIYRETEDPRGGSTGAGLDFVAELRLTPSSFNARTIMTETAVPYVAPYFTGTPEGIPMGFNSNNELFVVYCMQNPIISSDIDTNGYRGMTIDKNSYFTLYLRRYKFPKPTNQ